MAETTRTSSRAGTPRRDDAAPGNSDGARRQDGVGGALAADARNMRDELLAAVRDSAGSLLDEQRNRAATQIATLGDVLRRSAEALDDEMPGAVARYAGDAARQIDDFAEALRSRSWNQLTGDIETFARRWPMAFLASAIGLGFVAGRVLIASTPRPPKEAATPAPQRFAARDESPGGARHDYGAVSGSVTGSAMSGYGAAAHQEKP